MARDANQRQLLESIERDARLRRAERPLGALYTRAAFARRAAAVVVIYSTYTRRSTNAWVDSRSALTCFAFAAAGSIVSRCARRRCFRCAQAIISRRAIENCSHIPPVATHFGAAQVGASLPSVRTPSHVTSSTCVSH